MVSTRSKNMFLSVRVLFGSFNPGVSISVIFPLEAILTSDVTAIRDLDALNTIGASKLLKQRL